MGAPVTVAPQYGSMEQYRVAQQPVMYVQPEAVQPQSEGVSSAVAYGVMGFGAALAAAAFLMPAQERRVAMFATTLEAPSSLIMDTSKSPKPWSRHKDELIKTASYIASPGKGILASDESTGTCALRLKDIGMEGTVEEQRGYRQMLYSTPGLSEHIAGAIMFEKTLYESTVLKVWGGKKENEQKAQELLRAICQVNGLAQMGKYTGELAARGHPSTTGSLYEKGYQY